jgi:hypothetical protein
MSRAIDFAEFTAGNPLDLVEQLVSANEWPADRSGDEELAAAVEGHWNRYQLWFTWRAEQGLLQFSCAFDLRVPVHRLSDVRALLAMINERMWLGHFDYVSDGGMLMFRHALLLGTERGATPTQIEDLVEVALNESERYFPAFMFLLWGGKTPDDALVATMLETVGEA